MIPELSIIIPCFNHGLFLTEALDSVKVIMESTSSEAIIVNDGSNETQTLSIFRELEEKGWRILHQENQGLATARNNGIKASVGKYILPLDSDNLLIDEYVIQALAILNKDRKVDIVYSDSLHFGDDEFYNKVGDFDPCKLISANYIDACAIYRKEVWSDLGGYDSKMPAMGHEDWDFWIGALMKGKSFKYLPIPGFKYRVRNDSMLRSQSMKDGNKIRDYVFNKYNKLLFESIEFNYNPEDNVFKSKYLNLKAQLKSNRIKSVIKIIFGLDFY